MTCLPMKQWFGNALSKIIWSLGSRQFFRW